MIKKNEDGLYDLVCDNCEDTQAELDQDASFDEFMEAVEYKKQNRDRWFGVKSRTEKDPKKGWFDLCYVCYNDKDVVARFRK